MLRGVIVGKRPVDNDPERGLLAAVVLQAIADARRGDLQAVSWLDDLTPALGDELGVNLTQWRAARGAGRRNRRTKHPMSNAERGRLYRAKKRVEPPGNP